MYTEKLLRAMVRIGSEHTFHLFCSGLTSLPRSITHWLTAEPRVTLTHQRWPNKLSNLIHIGLGRPYLDTAVGGVDVWFMPNMMFGQVSRHTPLVLTVHDLSFRYPNFFNHRGNWWHRLVRPGHLMRQSQRIISVSENTKRDIVATYGIAPERITVIQLGIEAQLFAAVPDQAVEKIRNRYHLERPYVLSIGTVNPRKNIDGLIAAWGIVTRQTQGAYELIIAGHAGMSRSNAQLSRVRFVDYVPEADKPAWYRGAAAFVYPSYFEGFGLPILEAMAARVPVVTSAAPALGEVGSDGVLMTDPYDAAGLAEAIFRVLQDHDLRRALIARGSARVQQFSWERAAQATLATLMTASKL